ncbi:MAG: transcription-repair coupling factor [Christensenellaceae bacterium]|nr:transcription-repair coupling factor [Christensenellaceae bacterium]
MDRLAPERFIDFMSGTEAMKTLTDRLDGEKTICAEGIGINAKGAFLHALSKASGRRIVYLGQPAADMDDLCPAVFPDEDIQFRRAEERSRENDFRVIELLFGDQDVTVIPVNAMLRPYMRPDRLHSAVKRIVPGMELDPGKLLSELVDMGYERVDAVYAKGQFAQRGEITDIFSPCHEQPLRIVFFDIEVETAKYFDPDTQSASGGPLEEACIYPASPYMLSESEKEKAAGYFRNFTGVDSAAGGAAAEYIISLEESGTFSNIDSFFNSFADSCTVMEYFDGAVFVVDSMKMLAAAVEASGEAALKAYGELEKEGEVFPAQRSALMSMADVESSLSGPVIDIGALSRKPDIDFGMRSPVGFGGNIAELARSLKERAGQGWQVLLAVGGKAESLSRALMDMDIIAPVDSVKAAVCCLTERLIGGYEFSSEKVLFLGEGDVYNVVRKRKQKEKKEMDRSDEELFAELKAGDYVVHEVHGRGRYLGLKTMEAAGTVGEYLELEYRDGDRLFIPTSQIGRIQKYIGSEDGEPMLSRLGGKEWESAKSKARESVKKLAFDLVELYSGRYGNSGYAFGPDTVWQAQFEDGFEYELTDGQARSLMEIKADMESGKVMDRLLLGDVGYGKTELAARAAFKAVMDGKQVCMLVPTTLLARQHGMTFRERFAGFPVTVEVLSRNSGKRADEIKEGLKSGKVDIVIGTHKLLSDSVGFSDLGLLIIDEEQRFGVSHKEKIKLLKKNVDTLTLSATPIPRTLEMSLIGVRDLSMIKTPPVFRKEPVAYVIRYSESLVREAVRKEIGRGGQVYFVVRQVQQIPRMLEELRRIVPEARIDVAHGQMSGTEMEKAVTSFIDGETDILLCTTIIESGIDIPAVNTIIVYEADRFGLSQLYQLRGRVGRMDKTPYAYFTFLSENMGENAKKRLAAIKEFTSLGSGFKIAMRDLQIRGAGNLLGPEQSGHMASVGYTMYCKMMKDAVNAAKGKPQEEPEIDTTVDLGVPAFIPSSYIDNDALKLDVYKSIARVGSLDDAKEVSAGLADRYGRMPEEVNNLMVSAVVKKYASSAGIASVIKKGGVTELIYDKSVNFDLEKLMRFLQENRKMAQLRATTPPAVLLKAENIKGMLSFLSGLKHCK